MRPCHPLLPALLLAGIGLASCSGPAGYEVQASSPDRISIDYSVAEADPQEVWRSAEAHCRKTFRHASRIDTAYLRGNTAATLWRSASFACIP